MINIFGKKATHPQYGRVLVSSHMPSKNFAVRVHPENSHGNAYDFVDVRELDFDPDSLHAVEELDAAPIGTIIDTISEGLAEKRPGGWYCPYIDRDEVIPAKEIMNRHIGVPVVRWGE